MITAGAEMQVLVATKPVDFRNYAEPKVMPSPRRDVIARRGFLAGLIPGNQLIDSCCAAAIPVWCGL